MATTMQKRFLGGQRKAVERNFRNMTREEVLALQPRERVWFVSLDEKARMLTITGKVRTWKRDADRVEVPYRYGLYEYGCFNLNEAVTRLLKPVEGSAP